MSAPASLAAFAQRTPSGTSRGAAAVIAVVRMSAATALATIAALVCASAAAADGLPVLGVDVGPKGVALRTVRWVTLPAGSDTIVARTGVFGGRVLTYTTLPGTFTIPAVAYDGSASGLSADGRTLVLIEPRVSFPRARTTFAIVDAKRLRLVRRFTLRGDFSFDAISPHAKTLFLIQYVAPKDPSRYAVRAYDLAAGRLLPAPVVDPRERDEAMRGSPVTRTTSPDGRWAYTLYDGGGATPFVHALDTTGRTARCIDMPMLVGRRDLYQLRLTVADAGRRIEVRAKDEPIAFVETSDFRVTVPQATSGGIGAWKLAGASTLAALFAAAVFLGIRRSRNRIRVVQATTR